MAEIVIIVIIRHLLTRSRIMHPEVYIVVPLASFCFLGCNFLQNSIFEAEYTSRMR
jgi:hypothetical protein